MKEIPIPLVRANQLFLVVGTLVSFVLNSPLLLACILLIMVLPLILGAKGNLVFRLAKPLLQKRLVNAETEALELQRFNNSIAVILLAIGNLILWSNGHWSAWLFVGMVTVAAGLALVGFCIGCIMYYQLKQLKHKISQ